MTRSDVPRTIFAVLFMGGLIAASVWILWPFLPALIWATMIVVATWPVLLRIQRWLWGRRSLAVIVMTVAGWAGSLGMIKIPSAPLWLEKIPLIGKRIVDTWTELAASGPEDLARKLSPYAGLFIAWFAKEVGGFGIMTVQFLLTLDYPSQPVSFDRLSGPPLLVHNAGQALCSAGGR